jgi:hypothetical protein
LRGQFPARVRAAIDGHPVLGAIVEPTLQVLDAARAQLLVYDKAVIQRGRSDDTARLLMSPGVGVVVALAYMAGVEAGLRARDDSDLDVALRAEALGENAQRAPSLATKAAAAGQGLRAVRLPIPAKDRDRSEPPRLSAIGRRKTACWRAPGQRGIASALAPQCSLRLRRRRQAGQRPLPGAGIDGAECSSLASRHGRFRRKPPSLRTLFDGSF